MGRYGTAEKVLFLLTASGGLLVVGALALFALSGSAFVPDLLRIAAGFTLGMAAVALLTGSPRSGRRVAAPLLVASVVGALAFALVVSRSGVGGGVEFIGGLLGSIAAGSVASLLRIDRLAPGGDQATRRRS